MQEDWIRVTARRSRRARWTSAGWVAWRRGNEAKGGPLRRRAAGSQGMGGALEAAGQPLRADVVLQPISKPTEFLAIPLPSPPRPPPPRGSPERNRDEGFLLSVN